MFFRREGMITRTKNLRDGCQHEGVKAGATAAGINIQIAVIGRKMLFVEPSGFLSPKIDYTTGTEKPDRAFKPLKRLVGERGFEPPTPWSRTRFQALLKSVEIYGI